MPYAKRFLLLLCLLCLCTAACAEPVHPILDAWDAYLACQEDILSCEIWAYDTVLSLAATPDWDTLLRARAAVYAALHFLEARNIPENTLTEAALAPYADRDLSFVRYELDALNQALGDERMFVRNTMQHLLCDVLYQPTLDCMQAHADFKIRLARCHADYAALASNYLLLQIGDASPWDTWQKAYPTLFADTPWSDDVTKVQTDTDHVLDTMEGLLVDIEKTTQMTLYSVHSLEDALESGNIREIQENMSLQGTIPPMLLVPAFLDAMTLQWENIPFFTDDAGNMALPRVFCDLTQPPHASLLTTAHVTRSQIEAYLQDLQQYQGLTVFPSDTVDDRYIVPFEPYSFVLQWTDGNATLYFPEETPCMVPLYYLLSP